MKFSFIQICDFLRFLFAADLFLLGLTDTPESPFIPAHYLRIRRRLQVLYRKHPAVLDTVLLVLNKLLYVAKSHEQSQDIIAKRKLLFQLALSRGFSFSASGKINSTAAKIDKSLKPSNKPKNKTKTRKANRIKRWYERRRLPFPQQ